MGNNNKENNSHHQENEVDLNSVDLSSFGSELLSGEGDIIENKFGGADSLSNLNSGEFENKTWENKAEEVSPEAEQEAAPSKSSSSKEEREASQVRAQNDKEASGELENDEKAKIESQEHKRTAHEAESHYNQYPEASNEQRQTSGTTPQSKETESTAKQLASQAAKKDNSIKNISFRKGLDMKKVSVEDEIDKVNETLLQYNNSEIVDGKFGQVKKAIMGENSGENKQKLADSLNEFKSQLNHTSEVNQADKQNINTKLGRVENKLGLNKNKGLGG